MIVYEDPSPGAPSAWVQCAIREQESLMNRILASPVDRLSCRQFDMQTMCYVLLAFHTTRISLLFNQKEDILLLKLKDITVAKEAGEGRWTVTVGRRNLKADRRQPYQHNSSTFQCLDTNVVDDLPFDIPVWMISYLLRRGVFERKFKTVEDLMDCKDAVLQIDPVRKEEPLFTAWNMNGTAPLEPIRYQTLTAASIAVGHMSLKSGIPFDTIVDVEIKWPPLALGQRTLSVAEALKSRGKRILPKIARTRTVVDAWEDVRMEVQNTESVARAWKAVGYILAMYQGNLVPVSLSRKRNVERRVDEAMCSNNRTFASTSYTGPGGQWTYETCMQTIEVFNNNTFSDPMAPATGEELQRFMMTLDRAELEKFHRMDAETEVLSSVVVGRGFEAMLRCLLGS